MRKKLSLNPPTFLVIALYSRKRRNSQIEKQLKVEITDDREVS